MLQVGITGGIGTGKTTVCAIFEILGIPVYYADAAAKQLMQTDPELIRKIKSIFGDEIYKGNELQRQQLAQIVFQDKSLLAQLNEVVHPAVLKDHQQWQLKPVRTGHPGGQQKSPYTIKEAALLFESGSYKSLDKIITVIADKNVRLERLQKRDNTSIEAIEARMANQMPDDEKAARSDYIISNNKDQLLIPQVLEIHRQLLNS